MDRRHICYFFLFRIIMSIVFQKLSTHTLEIFGCTHFCFSFERIFRRDHHNVTAPGRRCRTHSVRDSSLTQSIQDPLNALVVRIFIWVFINAAAIRAPPAGRLTALHSSTQHSLHICWMKHGSINTSEDTSRSRRCNRFSRLTSRNYMNLH